MADYERSFEESWSFPDRLLREYDPASTVSYARRPGLTMSGKGRFWMDIETPDGHKVRHAGMKLFSVKTGKPYAVVAREPSVPALDPALKAIMDEIGDAAAEKSVACQ